MPRPRWETSRRRWDCDELETFSLRRWRTKNISEYLRLRRISQTPENGAAGNEDLGSDVPWKPCRWRIVCSSLYLREEHNFYFWFLSERNHCLFLSAMKPNFIYLFLSATKNLTKRRSVYLYSRGHHWSLHPMRYRCRLQWCECQNTETK